MKTRKEKRNKYLKIVDAELDLHGLFRDEAMSAVKEFLDAARKKGYKRIRIVTGRGWHSPDGKGVLKTVVQRILDDEELFYSDAKINEGGSGAINIEFKN